jgi:hypothetical protein
MSEVRLGSHKVMGEVVASVLGQEKEPHTNKNEFLLERHKKGGVTSLEGVSQG